MMQKMQQIQNLVQNPQESKQLRALTGAFAELEREQRAELRGLLVALGDPEAAENLPELPDHDTRVSQMCETLASRVRSDLSPWEIHAKHYLEVPGLNAEAAEPYAGLEADEWTAAREKWVAAYRQKGLEEAEYSDEELLEHYTRDTFGVSLETFEEEVVAFDPARLYERVMAGEFQTHTDALAMMSSRIGEDPLGGEGDDELEVDA